TTSSGFRTASLDRSAPRFTIRCFPSPSFAYRWDAEAEIRKKLMAEERTEVEKSLIPEDTAIMRPFAASRSGAAPYDQGYTDYGVDPDGNSVHLRELWRIIRKRKWLVTLIVGVATILLTIEVHRTPSIYQAQSDILIGKDAAAVVQTGSQVIKIDDS